MQIESFSFEVPITQADRINIYLVVDETTKDETTKTAIDAGFCSPHHIREVLELKPDRFLLTHHHLDHVGAAFSGIESYMHPLEEPFLKLYTSDSFADIYKAWTERFGIPQHFIHHFMEMFSELKRLGERIGGRMRLKYIGDLQEISGMLCIHTPGHSPGHCCYYLPDEKALFSGDLILSETTTHVGFYPGYEANPLASHLQSLKRVLTLEVDVAYPAHEDVIKNPDKRIEQLLNHYKGRINEVLELTEVEGNLMDIASRIRWNGKSFERLSQWDKLLALSETLACLRYLEGKGDVKAVQKLGEVVRFERVR